MTIVSVRLNKEEEQVINGYALLTGQPISQLFKQALIREVGIKALAEHEDDPQTFTLEDMADELGINL